MIEIKTLSGWVLYTAQSSTDVRAAVVEAAKARADLREADLHGANLREADLHGANLYRADLHGADLREANLHRANLHGADLHEANLYGANLHRANLDVANLHGANLYGADLHGANLYEADLHGANLHGADLREAKHAELAAAQTNILPEGDLVGWKVSAESHIIKLRIPAEAKRSNATGRKCRAEYAEVLEIVDSNGNPVDTATSRYDSNFGYVVGATVRPGEPFCEDRWQECASGVHFFITREEALEW